MSKLKKLTVRGYQSHEDSVFFFAEGLTVITGPSGHGKTSGTMRPIKWLAFGEPAGDDFLHTLRDESTGEIKSRSDQVQIIAEMYDGVTIEKIRRKKKTTHRLSTMEEPFEKAETPLEVTEALGLNIYNFGDFETAINFAYQLEAPFLLSESPSAGAKVLGKLAGTEAVDMAIKSVSKDTHKVRGERDKAKKDIESKEAELLDYLFLEDAISALGVCDSLVIVIDNADKRRGDLMSIKGIYESLVPSLDKYKSVLAKYENVDSLRNSMGNLMLLQSRCDKLAGTKLTYEHNRDLVLIADSELEQLQNLSVIKGIVETTEAQINKLKILKDLSTEYTSYSQRVIVQGKQVSNLELEVLQNLSILLFDYNYQAVNAGASIGKCDVILEHRPTLQQLGVAYEKFVALKPLLFEYRRSCGQIAIQSDKLRAIENVGLANRLLVYLEEKVETADRLKLLKSQSFTAAINLKACNDSIASVMVDIAIAKKCLSDAWEAAGGTCPLCEQPTNL